ncbi:MAG: hypothetical protein EB059_03850 [Alphaproteobacteria bacterium]|nr:hypothetical protein [Alphaproteobacteria bacterium]
MELKNITIYLPLLAGIGWGLAYVINARNYEVITVSSNLIAGGIGVIIAGFIVSLLLNEKIDFTPFFTHPQRGWFWISPTIALLATIALQVSLKFNSATYTGLAELIYVILIPIFAYFLFGQKQLNTTMLIGGALMLCGVGFVVYGQLQKS